MGQLVVVEFLSVDGVMQGLGSPAEDTEGGFAHGGWGARYAEGIQQVLGPAGLDETDGYLFGRKTYEKMAAYWPHQPDSNPIAAHLNAAPKYVVSGTLTRPDWQHTEVISSDILDTVRDLKDTVEGDIAILGSGELCAQLLSWDLVDEFRLFIHPLLLGTGKRQFRQLPDPKFLTLRAVSRTDLGTVALVYQVTHQSRPSAEEPKVSAGL